MRPAVDLSSLLELRTFQVAGRADAIAGIVTQFLAETTERLPALRRAVSRDEAQTLASAAHALKGISGTVGANEMLDLATRLEEIGNAGHTVGAADLLAQLEAAFLRAQPIFDELRLGA